MTVIDIIARYLQTIYVRCNVLITFNHNIPRRDHCVQTVYVVLSRAVIIQLYLSHFDEYRIDQTIHACIFFYELLPMR